MHQAVQLQDYQIGFCILCRSNPIKIKKWGLCQRCYDFSRKKGFLQVRAYNKTEIPKEEKHGQFCSRLKERYGAEILNDLKALKDTPFLTLTEVGEKYGVTREYIRQIFKKYHEKAYTKFMNEKIEKVQAEIKSLNCLGNPLYKVANYEKDSLPFKGAQGEKMVLDKCNELGYNIQIPCERDFDFYINGYKVDAKTACKNKAYHKGSPRKYFHFKFSKKQKLLDFLICVVFPYKQFFVVPQKAYILSNGNIIIPDEKTPTVKKHPPSRYLQYKEAWHLLNHNPPVSGR